jgi:hypothetical protein
VPETKTRCCRSTPRCRTCPLRFAAEIRAVNGLAKPPAHLPEHLAGVPNCLHKYEPLFRRGTPAPEEHEPLVAAVS